MKGDYEEFHALKVAKNKPNSKPNKANLLNTSIGRMVEHKRKMQNNGFRSIIDAKYNVKPPWFGYASILLLRI